MGINSAWKVIFPTSFKILALNDEVVFRAVVNANILSRIIINAVLV